MAKSEPTTATDRYAVSLMVNMRERPAQKIKKSRGRRVEMKRQRPTIMIISIAEKIESSRAILLK
jgi:hypothetical protein